jgi:ribonuclease P protein component
MNETDLSTEHPQTGQDARISQEDVDQGRPGRDPVPPGKGASPAVGVTRGGPPARHGVTGVGRLRSRRAFEAVRRYGRNGRSGPLTVSYLGQPAWSGPHFAYAIGRQVGPAVSRNRLRRRLRAIVADDVGSLPAGAYLVRSRAEGARLGFDELKMAMTRALERATDDHSPHRGAGGALPEEPR